MQLTFAARMILHFRHPSNELFNTRDMGYEEKRHYGMKEDGSRSIREERFRKIRANETYEVVYEAAVEIIHSVIKPQSTPSKIPHNRQPESLLIHFHLL